MNDIEIIKGAREILSDPANWRKDGRVGEEGLCILNAMAKVAALEYWNDRALLAARKLVEVHLPEGENSAWAYNDNIHTTHQDILDLLDKTLADLGGLGE